MEELSFLYFVILPLRDGRRHRRRPVAVAHARRALRLEGLGAARWPICWAAACSPSFPTRLPRPGWAGCGSTGCSPRRSTMSGGCCCSSSAWSSATTGTTATSHTARWFWAAHSVHHSPNQLNLSAAYRLGWFGKFTGTTLFFTPLVLLGFTPDRRAVGPVPEPALPVLAARRLDPQAGLAGIRVQHAVEPPRPSRAQSGISRRQLSAAC